MFCLLVPLFLSWFSVSFMLEQNNPEADEPQGFQGYYRSSFYFQRILKYYQRKIVPYLLNIQRKQLALLTRSMPLVMSTYEPYQLLNCYLLSAYQLCPVTFPNMLHISDLWQQEFVFLGFQWFSLCHHECKVQVV